MQSLGVLSRDYFGLTDLRETCLEANLSPVNRSFIISAAKIMEFKIQGNVRKTTRIEKTLKLRADFHLAAVTMYFWKAGELRGSGIFSEKPLLKLRNGPSC